MHPRGIPRLWKRPLHVQSGPQSETQRPCRLLFYILPATCIEAQMILEGDHKGQCQENTCSYPGAKEKFFNLQLQDIIVCIHAHD
jgi:hypothetical protein